MTILKNISSRPVPLSGDAILLPGEQRDVHIGLFELHGLYRHWLQDQEDPSRWDNVIPVIPTEDSPTGTATQYVYFGDTQPIAPGPWIWYKTEGGVVVDIVLEA